MSDCVKLLKSLRSKSLNKLVFPHLNIKSIRNKSELLVGQVKGKINALVISETKIENSFPTGNFVIDGYSTPYILYRNSNSDRILLYIREDILPYLIATVKDTIEISYVQLNLRNEKYLINSSYDPHKTMISN